MFRQEPSLATARFEAQKIVKYYGFQSPNEISLEDIAYHQGISIEYSQLNKVEALLLRKSNKGIICVSDREMETGRRRFAVAHELGHWYCHSGISQVWLCTSDSIQAYKGNAHEIEANAFAAELLMPRSWLTQRVGNQQLTVRLICQIAEEFGTTLTATAVRLVEESKDDCCVVFSDTNSVRWHKKSRTADGIWIAREISEESRARDCDTEPQDSRGPRKVAPAAWLSGRSLRDYTEVWEESVFLPTYRIAITLLQFV